MLGQQVLQARLGQVLKRAATVSQRAPERRERAIGPNQALLHGRVAPGPGLQLGQQVLAFLAGGHQGAHHVEQHGLNNVAVVVVPVKIGAVAIRAIALVPGLVLLDGVVRPHQVAAARELEQGDLNNSAEQ